MQILSHKSGHLSCCQLRQARTGSVRWSCCAPTRLSAWRNQKPSSAAGATDGPQAGPSFSDDALSRAAPPPSAQQQQQQQQQPEASDEAASSPSTSGSTADPVHFVRQPGESTAADVAAAAAADAATVDLSEEIHRLSGSSPEATSCSSEDVRLDPLGRPGLTPLTYGAATAAYAILGISLVALAPSMAVSPAFKAPPQFHDVVTVLIGCLGAALIRAASLFWFVEEGAELEELHTWRYQRVNVLLLIVSATTALLQLQFWSAVHPLLLMATLAVAGSSAALCGKVLHHYSRHGIVFASALGTGSLTADLAATAVYFIKDISSLAGMLLSALVAVSGWAAWVLLTSSPAATASTLADLDPAVAYLRKLCGAGLLLMCGQCHSLLEYASRVRILDLLTAVKVEIINFMEQQHPSSAPAHADPSRFNVLLLGFFTSAALQAVALWRAHALQVDVSGPDPLWALMYWSLMFAAATYVVLFKFLDWQSVGRLLFNVGNYAAKWLATFAGLFFFDWGWVANARR